MERPNSFQNWIKIFLIVLPLFIFAGCTTYNCGDQIYTCLRMFSTMPYEKPIKYDYFSHSILYADGKIIYMDNKSEEIDIVSLKEICNSDTVCDIEFYDNEIQLRNYSYIFNSNDITDDSFKVVLCPNKCVILNWDHSVRSSFGFNGPDSTILMDAVDIDINYEKMIFIIDKGDNSVKTYNYDGIFISRWTNIGYPDRFKIYDGDIFILDKSDDSIKQYSLYGEYIQSLTNGYEFDDITAFTPPDEDGFWVSDLGGSRLTLISGGSRVAEFNGDYCYREVNFNFGLIYSLDNGNGFMVVDLGGNLLIRFSKVIVSFL